jgi:hypothetical protein
MIGRTLGIGVRVFARIAGGRIAGQQLGSPQQPASAHPQVHQPAPVAGSGVPNRAAGQATARATIQAGRTLSRGMGGFLGPFRRVGGILWLEVTGVFFLLPVVLFAPALWRAILAYPHSSDHRTLWLTAGLMALFLYLGISSFWRAHRRSMQG